MRAGLVSIITPAYRAARFIGETIESVQAQTYADWELLITEDRSPDETAAVVERYAAKDPRVKLLRHERNLGPAEARNTSVRAASGEYLAFLDSDDLWRPTKLEEQLADMRARGLAFSYTEYRRFLEDGSREGSVVRVPDRLTYGELLGNTAITTSTVLLDRSRVGEIRLVSGFGYDDFILWLSILKRGVVAHAFHRDLTRYRVARGSVSSRPTRSARWVWRIYREHEGLGLLRASWCLAGYAWRAIRKRRTLELAP